VCCTALENILSIVKPRKSNTEKARRGEFKEDLVLPAQTLTSASPISNKPVASFAPDVLISLQTDTRVSSSYTPSRWKYQRGSTLRTATTFIKSAPPPTSQIRICRSFEEARFLVVVLPAVFTPPSPSTVPKDRQQLHAANIFA
jgi:hypothetical protein